MKDRFSSEAASEHKYLTTALMSPPSMNLLELVNLAASPSETCSFRVGTTEPWLVGLPTDYH